MYSIEKIPLFRPITNTIRYIDRNTKYVIIYIPDNTSLDETIRHLSILKQDIRNVFIPKERFRKLNIVNTNEYSRKMKKQGYISNTNKSNPYITKQKIISHIYDTSLFFNKFDEMYNNRYDDLFLQRFFFNYIEGIKNKVKSKIEQFNKKKLENNNIKIIIIYNIDTNKPIFSNIKKRKIYAFYKYLIKGHSLSDFCDYFLLSITKEIKTIHIKLFDNDLDYKLNPQFIAAKLNLLLGKIKTNEELVEKQLDEESLDVIKEINENIKEDKKELELDNDKIETALKFTAKHNYELYKKIIDKIENSDNNKKEIKKSLAALFSYTVSKDENHAKILLKTNIKNKKTEEIIEKIIEKNSKQIIENKIDDDIVTNKLPVYNKLPIHEIVDKKIPVSIFEKRRVDFKENLFKDIKNIINELSKKEYPLYLDKIEVKEINKLDEVKENKLLYIYVTLKNENGKKHTVNFILPNIDETGSFTLNGYKKILVNQLTLKPIFFNDEYEVKINTYYSTIALHNKIFRNKRLYRGYMVGLHIPLSIPLFIMSKDVNYILKEFKLDKIEIKDKKSNKDKYYIYFNKDKKYLIFDNDSIENYPESRSFFESLNIINWKKLKDISSEDFFDPEIHKQILIKLTGNKNAPFLIKNLYDNLLDPINKEILNNMGYPTELVKLMIVLMKKITKPIKDKRNALDKQRLRNIEIITQLFYQQVMMAYNNYYSKRKMGNENATLEIDSFKIFKEFVNNQLVRVKENICPVEQLSLATRVTYVGVGGLKVSDAATLSMRALDDTAFGIIDPVDTPEGQQIGVSQNLANGTILTDKRGLFGIKPLDLSEGSGVIGISGSFSPFISNDEPTRIIMATNQSKQATILKHPQIPMVQTGYESLYTSFLDDDFIKKSPVNGTIFDYKEGEYIKIKDSNNKIHTIDIKYKKLKSGQSVDCISEFKLTKKIGDKIKKNEIIAEGGGITNGVITQGSSVLMAWGDFKGYTFEDGVVISESLVKNENFVSQHIKSFEIFLYPDSTLFHISKIGDQVKAGEPLLKFTNKEIFEYIDLDDDEIIDKQILVKAPYDCEILDIRIYPNIDIGKFKLLLHPYINFLKKNPELKNHVGNFKLRGEKFNGILIEIDIKYYANLHEGDKLVNRHGNKGVIAKIVPEDEMPITPWGDKLEVMLNPLSIVNRGIVGQLYEIYIGLISWKLGQIFLKDYKKFLRIFKDIITILDNTKTKNLSKNLIKHFEKLSKKEKDELEYMLKNNIMRGIPIIVPPFKEPKNIQIQKALKMLNLKPKYSIYFPKDKYSSNENVPIGYIYLYKVEHMVTKKMSSRSVSSYTPKTMQPPQGKSKGGGQRIGEFDSWCLFSYDANNVIREFFGPASDDQLAKKKMLENILQEGETELISTENSPTVDLIRAYMKALHITGK